MAEACRRRGLSYCDRSKKICVEERFHLFVSYEDFKSSLNFPLRRPVVLPDSESIARSRRARLFRPERTVLQPDRP